jgi:tRNA threonylcarbamoyladenosine biosynthesis protein TsaB
VRILAFDTATRATTVAICDAAASAIEARDDPPPGQRPGHSTRLLAMIAEMMSRHTIGWDDIDRIAVGIGPGTFTGLRIGVSAGRALSRARGIPLVGISTLQSIAVNGDRSDGPELDAILAVIDARRGEVFAAGWPVGQAGEGPQALLKPGVWHPDRLAAAIAGTDRRWLAIGDGAVEFRTALERSGAVVPEDESELHRVSAICHCRLATALDAGAPDDIRPEYLRVPDAEIGRREPANP